MALAIPNAVNYPSPLNAVPAVSAVRDPPEGPKMIPVEILWATMGGAQKAISFNLFGNSALTFTQIAALSVDNSQCGADVDFIFADTLQTITIPAFAPFTIVPVFTNVTSMFVSAANAGAADVTRFAFHNYVPPPIAIPDTQEEQAVNSALVAITGAGNTQIIAAGINGIITSASIIVGGEVTAAGAGSFFLQGNAGIQPLFSTLIGAKIGGDLPGLILNITGTQVRFTNGVRLNQNGAWTPGPAAYVMANLTYRRTA